MSQNFYITSGTEMVIEEEGCEEERLTSFLWISLAKYTGDVISHNIVDDCVDISEEGDGPVSGHVQRLDLIK